MEFIKKQAAGFYFTVLTVIFTIVGLVFYLINCNTSYFSNLGVHGGLVACVAIAAILQAGHIIGSEAVGQKMLLDILPVASGVLLVAAFTIFLSLRVNSIATIMTFENNAQTMSDLSSALVGMVCCLIAVILNIAASFLKIVRD